MAPRSRYQLIEIRNAEDVPCFVGMQRDGESFVDIAWQCRYLVDNALMRWLRSLPEAAQGSRALGPAVQLNLADGAGLGCLLSRADRARRGSWPSPPDFALWSATNRGGASTGGRFAASGARRSRSLPRSKRRPAAIRTSRDDIDERIVSGHPDKAGWTWWDA